MNVLKILKSITIASIVAGSASLAPMNAAQAGGYDAGFYAYVDNVAYWDVLNMRKWPASYSEKVGSIPDNGWGIWVERCKYVEDSSDWCKVKYAGKWGWVNSRYLVEYEY